MPSVGWTSCQRPPSTEYSARRTGSQSSLTVHADAPAGVPALRGDAGRRVVDVEGRALLSPVSASARGLAGASLAATTDHVAAVGHGRVSQASTGSVRPLRSSRNRVSSERAVVDVVARVSPLGSSAFQEKVWMPLLVRACGCSWWPAAAAVRRPRGGRALAAAGSTSRPRISGSPVSADRLLEHLARRVDGDGWTAGAGCAAGRPRVIASSDRRRGRAFR